MNELGRLKIATESDVFSGRQRVRSIAEAIGFDTTDQVRVATALSELGRVLVDSDAESTVVVTLQQDFRRVLSVEIAVSKAASGGSVGASAEAFAAGRRLMDTFAVVSDQPLAIRMTKVVPSSPPLSDQQIAEILDRLNHQLVVSPLEAFRNQNLELLETLEELTVKQDELQRLNEELRETNSGVLAMYNQLSNELEETNSGVVALYAELDERGAQLREANAAKSRFLASVSHELRSPLNSILALTRLIREPDSDPLSGEQAHQIHLMATSATELLGLVNDLLDLAKAESNELQPRREAVSIAALFADLRATLAPMAHKGVDLLITVADGLPPVHTDPTLLGQLVRNLVANALRFTAQGQVRVEVDLRGDVLSVIVSDTGIGIAPGDYDRIFEEFVQIPGPMQTRGKSTGLGLPYSRRVAETLGGSLTVTSQPGQGSTFTATVSVAAASEEQPAEALRLGTVLIVDDEATFRGVLRAMLSGVSTRILETDNASAAIDLLRQTRPDLVVLDLRMPAGGGELILSAAQDDAELSRIPMLVVTSASPTEIAALDLGLAREVLDKAALSRESLLNAVRNALDREMP